MACAESLSRICWLEIAVRYQMIYALTLMGVSFAATQWPGKLLNASGWLLVIGSRLFSGSLYLLSLTGIKGLGAIPPIVRSAVAGRLAVLDRRRFAVAEVT